MIVLVPDEFWLQGFALYEILAVLYVVMLGLPTTTMQIMLASIHIAEPQNQMLNLRPPNCEPWKLKPVTQKRKC